MIWVSRPALVFIVCLPNHCFIQNKKRQNPQASSIGTYDVLASGVVHGIAIDIGIPVLSSMVEVTMGDKWCSSELCMRLFRLFLSQQAGGSSSFSRQQGQLDWLMSHRCRQFLWKTCPHSILGVTTTSLNWNSFKQMGHSCISCKSVNTLSMRESDIWMCRSIWLLAFPSATTPAVNMSSFSSSSSIHRKSEKGNLNQL